MVIVAYNKNGNVYYDYNNERGKFVASNAKFVSVSGNYIVYEKNGHIYKAEVNSSGSICTNNILVR